MSDTAWHLAQINIGRLVAARGDPRAAPFIDALDRINALADAAPGVTSNARFPNPGEAALPPVDMQPDPWCIGRA